MSEDRRRARPRADWSEDARRRQNDYKRRERATIAADLPRDVADRFRDLCRSRGVSISSAVADLVRAEIERGEDPRGKANDYSLPPESVVQANSDCDKVTKDPGSVEM